MSPSLLRGCLATRVLTVFNYFEVSLATSVVMVNAGSFPGMALLGALSGEIFTFQVTCFSLARSLDLSPHPHSLSRFFFVN